MDKLVRGVHQFRRLVFEPNRAMYEQLAEGQRPHTLFITCSDSRLSTEALTQTGPGEIFVLRNAGNLVPPFGAGRGGGETATIEYAVAGLGVRHIVICGHTECGAMRALMDPPSMDELPETTRWLKHAEATRRIALAGHRHWDERERWKAMVQVNVRMQMENLRTHPMVAAGLTTGSLSIDGWVLDMRSGYVHCFDSAAGRFVPLPEVDDGDERATVASNGTPASSDRRS